MGSPGTEPEDTGLTLGRTGGYWAHLGQNQRILGSPWKHPEDAGLTLAEPEDTGFPLGRAAGDWSHLGQSRSADGIRHGSGSGSGCRRILRT